ncbi:MAG: HIT family protein [Chitinophagaceae bacterium]|nr:HIT family protein [Anaerolineae bacterium]
MSFYKCENMNVFEHPKTNKDVIFIAELTISTLMLFRDQRFRGYCILSFAAWDATSLDTLSSEEYAAFFGDLRIASKALRQALHPDHMNYELLGNTNPHLHWHIIPRYKSDPRWGRPIWEEYPRNEFNHNRYTLSDMEYHSIIEQIRAGFPT